MILVVNLLAKAPHPSLVSMSHGLLLLVDELGRLEDPLRKEVVLPRAVPDMAKVNLQDAALPILRHAKVEDEERKEAERARIRGDREIVFFDGQFL